MNLDSICKDWTSLHDIRKATHKLPGLRGDKLLKAIRDMVAAGELEHMGGMVGLRLTDPIKGQYQVRVKPKGE